MEVLPSHHYIRSMVEKCNKPRSDFKRYKDFPSKFTDRQHEAIVGWMLGDACIPKTKGRHNCMSFEQSESRSDYLEHVFNLLNPYTSKSAIKPVINDKTKWGKGTYTTVRFRTCTHPVFTDLRSVWYKDNIKVVPADIKLSWQSLAYWFADDGHNKQSGKDLVFCSESFTEDENALLASCFFRDLSLRANVCKRTGGTGFGIRLPSHDYFRFIEGIRPIISSIRCLSYKIDTSKASTKHAPRYSDDEKRKALEMHKAGTTIAELSELIGCHDVTIRRWING